MLILVSANYWRIPLVLIEKKRGIHERERIVRNVRRKHENSLPSAATIEFLVYTYTLSWSLLRGGVRNPSRAATFLSYRWLPFLRGPTT